MKLLLFDSIAPAYYSSSIFVLFIFKENHAVHPHKKRYIVSEERGFFTDSEAWVLAYVAYWAESHNNVFPSFDLIGNMAEISLADVRESVSSLLKREYLVFRDDGSYGIASKVISTVAQARAALAARSVIANYGEDGSISQRSLIMKLSPLLVGEFDIVLGLGYVQAYGFADFIMIGLRFEEESQYLELLARADELFREYLTRREAQVLAHIAYWQELYGTTIPTRVIASVMGIQQTTVRDHVAALFRKGYLVLDSNNIRRIMPDVVKTQKQAWAVRLMWCATTQADFGRIERSVLLEKLSATTDASTDAVGWAIRFGYLKRCRPGNSVRKGPRFVKEAFYIHALTEMDDT